MERNVTEKGKLTRHEERLIKENEKCLHRKLGNDDEDGTLKTHRFKCLRKTAKKGYNILRVN